jgi:hypothetical protein
MDAERPSFDWSRVMFVGEWSEDEAVAFARRVEVIADEERAKAALTVAETLPPEPAA